MWTSKDIETLLKCLKSINTNIKKIAKSCEDMAAEDLEEENPSEETEEDEEEGWHE